MNNNRSHDYENYVNSYGMQEIRNEAKNARMLKDAGTSGPNLLVRTANALGRLLARRRKKAQDYGKAQSYSSLDEKLTP